MFLLTLRTLRDLRPAAGRKRPSKIPTVKPRVQVLEHRTVLATITDLGTLPGDVGSAAYSINDAGQVVGRSDDHAFLWQSGQGMTDLGSLADGTTPVPSGINNAGQVVGTARHAVLWQSGQGWTDLGTLGGDTSVAWGINDAGQVVGVSDVDPRGACSDAFLWQSGRGISDLGPPFCNSRAYGINNAGQVVGAAEFPGTYAFLWQSGQGMTDLGTLPGDNASVAWRINDAGQVVGNSYSGHSTRVFLWQSGQGMTDLGGSSIRPVGINDADQVVGYYCGLTCSGGAFLWQSGQGWTDMNNLLPPGSGWTGLNARAINNSGQVVGWGTHNGQARAFLLDISSCSQSGEPPICYPSDIVPTALTLNSDGTLNFSYRVNVSSVPLATTIAVYWGNGVNPLPDLQHPMISYSIPAGTAQGSYTPDPFKAALIKTAPPNATSLLVIADPDQILGMHQSDETYALTFAQSAPLTLAQLMSAMPDLPEPDAQRYLQPLNAAMNSYGINSLEQKAMFLGQMAYESGELVKWREMGTNDHLIKQNWLNPMLWKGLDGSVPTPNGLTLNIQQPEEGPQKVFDLYWSRGSTLKEKHVLFANMTFTYMNGMYTANFPGAVPSLTLTSYLIIVDPMTDDMVECINNSLGNWSPQDALDFRGRGPIQLTGRYNYQKFAKYIHVPDLANYPDLLEDNVNHPELGFEAAGWYWSVEKHSLNHHPVIINQLVNDSAAETSVDFNRTVSNVINFFDKPHLQDRLKAYRLARSVLLTPPSNSPSSRDRGVNVKQQDAPARLKEAERAAPDLPIPMEQEVIRYIDMTPPISPRSSDRQLLSPPPPSSNSLTVSQILYEDWGLELGHTVREARLITDHGSARMAKLQDRTSDPFTLEDVERIYLRKLELRIAFADRRAGLLEISVF